MADPWWQSAVLYQIYPRSFQDSDSDGIGDLRGIVERLPYLVEIGVEALWLSPIFASPMADFGYDISDYTAVDPLFGSMADFDALLLKKNGSPSVEKLHGFGRNLGSGHLNIEGNRVYGEILAEIIATRPEWPRASR